MPSMGDVQIFASVGRNAANRHDDVVTVQGLINARLPTLPRPLAVDGTCGPRTIRAIEDVQRLYLHLDRPDGRVAPHGATLLVLTGRSSAPAKPRSGSGTFPPEVIAAAQASRAAWKIPASVTLAQWALESNWGRAMPAGSLNPFGIKAAAGQPYVEASTREVLQGQSVRVVARFRKFATLNEAFDQHGRLLATARPYAHARTLAGNPDAFADALTGVYATDPNYGTSLKRLMKSYNLHQYD